MKKIKMDYRRKIDGEGKTMEALGSGWQDDATSKVRKFVRKREGPAVSVPIIVCASASPSTHRLKSLLVRLSCVALQRGYTKATIRERAGNGAKGKADEVRYR